MCVFSTQYKDATFFNNVHHIFNIWGGQRVNAASGQYVREIFQNCTIWVWNLGLHECTVSCIQVIWGF